MFNTNNWEPAVKCLKYLWLLPDIVLLPLYKRLYMQFSSFNSPEVSLKLEKSSFSSLSDSIIYCIFCISLFPLFTEAHDVHTEENIKIFIYISLKSGQILASLKTLRAPLEFKIKWFGFELYLAAHTLKITGSKLIQHWVNFTQYTWVENHPSHWLVYVGLVLLFYYFWVIYPNYKLQEPTLALFKLKCHHFIIDC